MVIIIFIAIAKGFFSTALSTSIRPVVRRCHYWPPRSKK
jgi:hypothetical protein